MLLSGLEIEKNLNKNIIIKPFNKEQLNTNSYNITLDKNLVIYNEEVLDMKKDNNFRNIVIPPEGMIIYPGKIYLGKTKEYTETYSFVPSIEGRSSIGRLGINIHASSPYGNEGFKGFWTLEISCIQPVRIYANIHIGQIYYHLLQGETISYNSKKYQNNNCIQTSKIFEEF